VGGVEAPGKENGAREPRDRPVKLLKDQQPLWQRQHFTLQKKNGKPSSKNRGKYLVIRRFHTEGWLSLFKTQDH